MPAKPKKTKKQKLTIPQKLERGDSPLSVDKATGRSLLKICIERLCTVEYSQITAAVELMRLCIRKIKEMHALSEQEQAELVRCTFQLSQLAHHLEEEPYYSELLSELDSIMAERQQEPTVQIQDIIFVRACIDKVQKVISKGTENLSEKDKKYLSMLLLFLSRMTPENHPLVPIELLAEAQALYSQLQELVGQLQQQETTEVEEGGDTLLNSESEEGSAQAIQALPALTTMQDELDALLPPPYDIEELESDPESGEDGGGSSGEWTDVSAPPSDYDNPDAPGDDEDPETGELFKLEEIPHTTPEPQNDAGNHTAHASLPVEPCQLSGVGIGLLYGAC